MNRGALDTAATSGTGTLAGIERAAIDIFLLDFDLDRGTDPGPPPDPGQFFLIDCGGAREHLLPRPMSVHDVPGWNGDRATVRFLIEAVGWGTKLLCSMVPGDEVVMFGPTGKPFPLPERGKSLLIAGGMGIAPLYFVARRLENTGISYDLMAGFSSGERHLNELGGLSGGIEVWTEDGKQGRKGLVSEGVADRLDRHEYELVLTCGPEVMMETVTRLCEDAGVHCQASLTARMACGIGTCRGCVRSGTQGENLCVCTDGPVFDSRDVAWRWREESQE